MTYLVAGRVVDRFGKPVAGARVMIVSGTAPTPEIAQVTTDDGRFRLALPSGRFRIAAYHDRQGKAEHVLETGPDMERVQLIFP